MEKKVPECRVHIRVPEDLKRDYQSVCTVLGTTPSEHLRSYMRAAIELWEVSDSPKVDAEQKEPA